MADVSNKTIVTLLVIALIITISGTVISVTKLSGLGGKYQVLTGGATTGTGTSSVTVQGSASIVINDGTVTFPTGYYNGSCTGNYARINSNSSNASHGENFCWLNTTGIEPWSNRSGAGVSTGMTADFHQIENNGTTAINVTLDTDATNASTYFCGTGACPTTRGASSFVTFTTYNHESGSCGSGLMAENRTVLDITGENATLNATLCQFLNYENANDALNVSFLYAVPKDADQGAKTLTLTYTAAAK